MQPKPTNWIEPTNLEVMAAIATLEAAGFPAKVLAPVYNAFNNPAPAPAAPGKPHKSNR